jgi:dTDP-glucose 4,6-dehydratase
MKNILVTGGAGFIGSNFVHYLLENDTDCQIVNYDALTYAGNLANLQNIRDGARHQFVQGDIRDADLVELTMRKNHIDTIVHFAAETHVDRSILGPFPFIETNVVGTLTLLDTARKLWLDEWGGKSEDFLFHHISTDEVYGSLEGDHPSSTEDSPYLPNSPYAASKASSDHLVRAFARTYGLPILITNCSNNYGPFQFPEKFIPLVIANARMAEPIPIYGDGLQIRDWIYVIDHCDAIYKVMLDGRRGETYNVGGGNQITNLQLAETICALLDERFPASSPHNKLISFVDDRPGHDRRYALDCSKIVTEMEWSPDENIQSGLEKTLDWYQQNLEWIEGIQDRHDYRDWMKSNYAKRGSAS